jgi:hypothetical protein
MEHDPDGLNGMQLGGQEAVDLINKGNPAVGLSICLLEYIHGMSWEELRQKMTEGKA